MNATTEFRPSDVDADLLLREAFGKSEAECVAMLATTRLAGIGDDWTTEFAYRDLKMWARNDGLNVVNEFYRSMISMPGEFGGLHLIILGVEALVAGDYIVHADHDGVAHLRVTDKFVGVMRCFA